jgi:response regulator of citrate/malate metabolism
MAMPNLENAPLSILLIDDHDDWAKFFIGHLGKSVKQRASVKIDPQADLILVDEHLDAASIETVLEAAKNAMVISKVIVITAALDVDRVTRTLRKGVRDVRLKPYSLEELSSLWK